jgi:CRISPR-associated endoribonuclease Cas6
VPTLWSVLLEGPGEQAEPQQLHALLCEWLERGVDGRHNENVKGFTLQGWSTVGQDQWELLVGLVDDRHVPRLVLAAGKAASTPLLIGPPNAPPQFRVCLIGAAPARCLRAMDFEMLASSQEAPTTFTFETLSPLVVRSGTLTPGTTFGHLRTRWKKYAPESVRNLDCDFATCGLEFTELTLDSVPVKPQGEIENAVVGRFTIEATSGNEEQRRWLHRLGVLTTYAGLGSRTTHGLGITRYHAPVEAQVAKS